MNTSISTTNLSVRAKNALHGAGIHNVEQLKATPFEQLRKIRNMGKKSLTEVEDFLEDDEDNQPLLASQATLRDYFAARAMSFLMQKAFACKPENPEDLEDMLEELMEETVPALAYEMADAMLKAREQ